MSTPSTSAQSPRFCHATRSLLVGEQVVKRFRQPASVQVLILSAFEEEGWPPRIDDPLPPDGRMDDKTRLHDAINRLNRHQAAPLLRFFGDGTGRGIRWEFPGTLARRVRKPAVHIKLAAS